MIAVNHNLMAASTANALTSHYGRLQTSTQRLSSGLRINSAADDAAGLAIRELMRSDITALHQGVRNVNDAISMIQTFDGALGVIDEKLIRMKELAEQAATGTYDSTQRLMIDSEFQAMGAEIDRIARATDFNGIKLLDGKTTKQTADVATQAEIPMDPDDPDSPRYDVNAATTQIINKVWPGGTASQQGTWDLSGITDPSALAATADIKISNENIPTIDNNYLMITPQGITTDLPVGSQLNLQWTPYEGELPPGSGNFVSGCTWIINNINLSTPGNMPAGVTGFGTQSGFTYSGPDANGNQVSAVASFVDANGNQVALKNPGNMTWTVKNFPSFTSNIGNVTAEFVDNNGNTVANSDNLKLTIDLGNNNKITGQFTVSNGEDRALAAVSLRVNSKEIKVTPPPAPAGPTDPDNPLAPNYKVPEDVVRIHFGPGADQKEDFYDIQKHDATLKGLGLDGVEIKTQDQAQEALVQINDAIVAKDKIRAEYGAMQNRLENTQTNLVSQAENLQAAESRISDTDIAQEMMNFVRNQVLTQSAVAMLAQANSLPQMVLRLIG